MDYSIVRTILESVIRYSAAECSPTIGESVMAIGVCPVSESSQRQMPSHSKCKCNSNEKSHLRMHRSYAAIYIHKWSPLCGRSDDKRYCSFWCSMRDATSPPARAEPCDASRARFTNGRCVVRCRVRRRNKIHMHTASSFAHSKGIHLDGTFVVFATGYHSL